MNVELFMILLFAFSTATSLITEALKKVIPSNWSIDIVVIIVACIVGGGGMACFYLLNDIVVNSKDIVFSGLMVLANALTAMVGYDKVVEAVKQINGGK